MQKIEYISCICHTVLFFCPKRSQIKFYTLSNNEDNNSADIDQKDFINIYRECKSKPYSCFTIGITLPADNLLHFRKKYFRLVIKMLSTDKIKVLGDNIKANQALHNLD